MIRSARLECVITLLIACTACFALESPTTPIPGMPFVIGRLDSDKVDVSRPRLFVTPDEIARAKDRAKAEPRLRAIRDRLVAEADRQLAVEIMPIDESWWQAAKDKPWQETYPEVFQNTMLVLKQSAKPAADLALAWLLTGQEKYADKAASLLMNLAPYSFEAVHFDVGMNYTVSCIDALRAYDMLGGRLSTEQRGKLDRFMERLAVAVARNDVYWIDNGIGGGINNHLAWHKLMMGLLGLFYDRPEMVGYCLNGRRGLVPLLADGLLDDGLWCESSLTYQFAAIVPMLIMADCQDRMSSGREEVNASASLHRITAPNGRTVKQSFDSMFNVLAPDGLIPPIGDAYGARSRLFKVSMYEYCWKLWGDPKYAWLINQNPEPSSYLLFAPPVPAEAHAPAIGSILLPEHGYAFVRSHRDEQYWHNRDARCAFLTYDRSSVHANADKLSLMLFGLNRMLVSDVEGIATVPHAFSSQIQRELNRGGLSQNTVMIDGADQRCSGEMLDLVEFRDLPDEKRVTAADRKGILYDGVRQMRSIAMTSDYVLDVFQVDVGEKPRQIDWITHMMDEKASAPAEVNPLLAKAEAFKLPETGAYRWLRDPKSVSLSGTGVSPVKDAGGQAASGTKPVSEDLIALEFRDGQDRVGLRMLNTQMERLIVCGYPLNDKPDSGSTPMLIFRVNAQRAVFAAVWLVGDEVKDVQIKALPDHEGRLVYEVTANGKTREHQVPKLQ